MFNHVLLSYKKAAIGSLATIFNFGNKEDSICGLGHWSSIPTDGGLLDVLLLLENAYHSESM